MQRPIDFGAGVDCIIEFKKMKQKPEYSIGLYKLLTGRFRWILVPMGMRNIDLDSVMSANDYETSMEARSAAKLFMDRNHLNLHKPKDNHE